MDRHESLKILGLGPEADLESIKKAYRVLAFALHPDLNPDDPEAGYKFHQVNTAYVTLRREADQGQGKSFSEDHKGRTSRKEASRTYQRQARSGWDNAGTKNKKAWENQYESSAQQAREGFFYRQEEVLKDILNDPFAKQVFEDIFKRLKRDKNETSPAEIKKRRLKLEWGKINLDIDLSGGILAGIKKWFSSQLDDEQTVHLSPFKLRPGSSIRINVARRWAGPPQVINVNLPQDYVVGRPVRLKGMGRKIGPWKGDLYLRLLAK
ncbi:DnaJ domain-containing protein [Desulfonatronospira sp.]|uniref:J domain-containing protein n=1 Tax=Desulfonatronospira sp. TaxID=1962951 RepID=UPI0025B93E7D|nr:DnaJ domain-containing protein [Desulfonatronospira sp.]